MHRAGQIRYDTLLEVYEFNVDLKAEYGQLNVAHVTKKYTKEETLSYKFIHNYKSLLPLQSTHLKTNWINTGHYKNLNTIGKQNYQKPGVKAVLNFEFFESYHFIF